jgi:hypothetical protein
MFFAYLLWPVWLPLAYLLAEKVESRKYILASCLLLGMGFYCYIVFQFFSQDSIQAKVVGHSIVYAPGSLTAKMVYVACVIIPIFASSLPNMWIVGILSLGSFVVADYVYTYAYASIWCFACAIIFGGLYFVLKPEKEKVPS